MPGPDTHIETCEDLILTYQNLFEKHILVIEQMRNGEYAVIVRLFTHGCRAQITLPDYSELVNWLDKVSGYHNEK